MLSGHLCWFAWVQKALPPQGFDACSIRLILICSVAYIILAHTNESIYCNYISVFINKYCFCCRSESILKCWWWEWLTVEYYKDYTCTPCQLLCMWKQATAHSQSLAHACARACTHTHTQTVYMHISYFIRQILFVTSSGLRYVLCTHPLTGNLACFLLGVFRKLQSNY